MSLPKTVTLNLGGVRKEYVITSIMKAPIAVIDDETDDVVEFLDPYPDAVVDATRRHLGLPPLKR